jgi:hypothetical protein
MTRSLPVTSPAAVSPSGRRGVPAIVCSYGSWDGTVCLAPVGRTYDDVDGTARFICWTATHAWKTAEHFPPLPGSWRTVDRVEERRNGDVRRRARP